MKRIITFLFVAIAMTFSACSKVDKENFPDQDGRYYTFALGKPETKSILGNDANGKFGQWEQGDCIGTAIDDNAPGYAYITTSTTPVTFSIYKKGGLTKGMKVYTYYPFNSAASSATSIPFSIPVAQSQSGSTFDFDAMPMVGVPFEVPEEYVSTETNTEIGEIQLLNLGSLVDFQVYSSNTEYAGETILNVKFSANKAIAGSFTKSITSVNNDESTLTISGYTETDVTTTVDNPAAIGANRSAASHVYMEIGRAHV